LGRARYERADRSVDDTAAGEATATPVVRAGRRKGHRNTTIKTTSGLVTVARPKLRGTTEAFASRPFGKSVTRTNALESLVIAGQARDFGRAQQVTVRA
jgi:hypothetical protein